MVYLRDKLFRVAGNYFSLRGEQRNLTVLMYHRILADHDPITPDVTDAASFERHISAIAKVFNVLPLDEAINQLYENRLAPMSLAISFDDGHADNLEIATPILKKYGLHATFFVCTGFTEGTLLYNDIVTEAVRRAPTGLLKLDWLGLENCNISDVDSRRLAVAKLVGTIKYLDFNERAEACSRLEKIAAEPLPTDLMMNADQILKLFRKGMGIGCHTHNHPILNKVTDKEAVFQIEKNRMSLTDITGVTPRLFAYPNGKPKADYDARHIDMVRQAGFDGALTTSFGAVSAKMDRFQMPRLCPWDKNEKMLMYRILRMSGKSYQQGEVSMVN